GYGERLIFTGGDILTCPGFGTGTYDGVFLSNICHMLGEKENITLFKKVKKALGKGGEIIIHDQVLKDDKTGPEFAVLFRIHMLLGTKGGDTYSGQEYKEMLTRAGFTTFRKKGLRTGSSIITAK
ncbi:MAG: methyltransferase, partial [Nitrospinota bacterium]